MHFWIDLFFTLMTVKLITGEDSESAYFKCYDSVIFFHYLF